jgi:hypothetical protein
MTLVRVIGRECEGLSAIDLDECQSAVQAEALMIGREAEEDGQATLVSLRALLNGLKTIDAPKTLVFITQGFLLRDRSDSYDIGSLAAAARTSMYVFKLDTPSADVTDARISMSPVSDRFMRSESLELLAGASRGSLINVVGTGDAAFDRLRSELSGYYLLGVETGPSDKDGKAHPVSVTVARRGVEVRSRRQIMATRADQRPRTRQQIAIDALTSPLLLSALSVPRSGRFSCSSMPMSGPTIRLRRRCRSLTSSRTGRGGWWRARRAMRGCCPS